MRVADWIAEYLHSIGVRRVHGLMGGGAAGLNDGFIKHPGIEYICYHHEQGAGHAALGEAKYTGKLAVVNPTTGCAGTNCSTSVLNGYQDGVPVLFLSGNVRLDNTAHWVNERSNVKIRHYGVQEHDIVSTMKSITKYSKFVTTPDDVAASLFEAVQWAIHGRPGPVWVDIPANVQVAEMPEVRTTFMPFDWVGKLKEKSSLIDIIDFSKRPLIIAGMGIRQAGCVNQFMQFVQKYQIPFVTTYGAQDYAPHDHPLNIGAVGVRGTRFGNFAMQNADLLLIIGTSLGSSVIGYDPKQFNNHAYKVYIDIDKSELDKEIIPVDKKIQIPLTEFFREML